MTTHSTLFRFHTTPLRLISSSSFKPPKPSSSSSLSFTPTPLPARDTVIDFGKHKGKPLGTLPSTYLKWVSANLRARDTLHWAHLADQVLSDAVYRDRLEWESAENALTGNVKNSNAAGVSELLSISENFGWDNEDKVGWSKVNFELLGTSKGGRIPRKKEKSESVVEEKMNVRKKGEGLGEKRKERRERRVMKREVEEEEGKMRGSLGNYIVGRMNDRRKEEVDNSTKFPGRESLFRKAYSTREFHAILRIKQPDVVLNKSRSTSRAAVPSTEASLPPLLTVEVPPSLSKKPTWIREPRLTLQGS